MTRPNHLSRPHDPFDLYSDWLDEVMQAYAPDPQPDDGLSPCGLCRVARPDHGGDDGGDDD